MLTRLRGSSLYIVSSHTPRGAALLVAVLLTPAVVLAQCILVQDRGGPLYSPHIAIHFGDPADVPSHIRSTTTVDRNQPSMHIPIYVYNLLEGIQSVEFALHTPTAPLGFDLDPRVDQVAMNIESGPLGAVTSLQLSSQTPICGPARLGSLRLPTSDLPDAFSIEVLEHRSSGRLAVLAAPGDWRDASVDAGGALVGAAASSSGGLCGLNEPVQDLQAWPGKDAGVIDLSWRSGSGSYTLLRFRTDGQYPTDPWDGEFIAFLPSSIASYSHTFSSPGEARIGSWSITRGPYGHFYSASTVECGALVQLPIHLPVSVTTTNWEQVKSLYR